MARPIRVEFEGAVYHVTARGNERKSIYVDDEDRKVFLKTLEQCANEYGLKVHCFCLMLNHYHLVVETPRGNLSRAIGWLQTTYTIRFNHRHIRSGHLFQGRFKAHLVEADGYAMELLRYTHLNPVRLKDKNAVIPFESRSRLEDYRWSSHRAYLGVETAPMWLSIDWLNFFGGSRVRAQELYRCFTDAAFGKVIENPWDNLHAGLVLGSEEMQKRISEILQKKTGAEELAWVRRIDVKSHRQASANLLAERQDGRQWVVWLRVCLGGEKRIDVARSLGYKDGSGVTHLLKRLEIQRTHQPSIATKMASLEIEFEDILSSFKS